MARQKSSRRWLREHASDSYVERARREGYRSRAAFKLLEIQEKDKILRSGMVVVDLGAAPGGWSQLAARVVGSSGRVIALDHLSMDPLPDVEVLQGDFTEDQVLAELLDLLGGQPVDLVISDMAPNISGERSVDQPRCMYLADLALDFSRQTLKPGGEFLLKVFQGAGFAEFHQEIRASFQRVVTRKPKASRSRSREVYLVAKGFSGRVDTAR